MNRPKKPRGLGRPRALRMWGLYLLTLVAWVTVVLLLGVLAATLLSSVIWQPGPVYDTLTWMRDNVMLVGVLAVLAGWVAISYGFLARPYRRLADVAAAAGRLARPDETPIELPGLPEVERSLNAAREQALRDARAAREAEQRKNDLVVYLAHDLKTPLTSLLGYLTLLRDEPDLPEAARRRYTAVALEGAERLEDLINEFFDITRFSLTHLELERRPTDLRRMLEQLTDEARPLLERAGLGCRLDVPAEFVCVCDRDKLARVFDNLLGNACHYADPGTDLEIAGRREPGWLVLTFANRGPTIPPEKLERMFERFFRLDAARSSRTGNAGLGLAIAREIVEAHGGTIAAESPPGRVVFTVRLPDGPS